MASYTTESNDLVCATDKNLDPVVITSSPHHHPTWKWLDPISYPKTDPFRHTPLFANLFRILTIHDTLHDSEKSKQLSKETK